MLDTEHPWQSSGADDAGWPRSFRVFLLATALATFVFALFLAYQWLDWAGRVVATTGSDRVPWPFALLLVQLFTFGVAFLVFATFAIHVIRNRRLTTGWKIGWVVLLLIFGIVAQVLYWFRQIWRDA